MHIHVGTIKKIHLAEGRWTGKEEEEEEEEEREREKERKERNINRLAQETVIQAFLACIVHLGFRTAFNVRVGLNLHGDHLPLFVRDGLLPHLLQLGDSAGIVSEIPLAAYQHKRHIWTKMSNFGHPLLVSLLLEKKRRSIRIGVTRADRKSETQSTIHPPRQKE